MLPSSLLVSLALPALCTSLHGLHWRAESADKTLPLICVHGLTRNAWDFEKIAEAESSRRDVVALDMPGRGQSPPLALPVLYSYPTYVALATAWLEARGLKEIDWLGTSMGGLIGMMIAATKPGLIRRLVLNDIGPFLPMAALQRLATYVGKDFRFATFAEAERYCRATYADFGITADADWRRFIVSTIREAEGGGWKLHYDLRIAEAFNAVKADIDLWPLYEKINCPVLLLRGERSDLLRAADAEAMTRRGPRARLITFSGCGHAPALMSAEQVKVVMDFLASP